MNVITLFSINGWGGCILKSLSLSVPRVWNIQAAVSYYQRRLYSIVLCLTKCKLWYCSCRQKKKENISVKEKQTTVITQHYLNNKNNFCVLFMNKSWGEKRTNNIIFLDKFIVSKPHYCVFLMNQGKHQPIRVNIKELLLLGVLLTMCMKVKVYNGWVCTSPYHLTDKWTVKNNKAISLYYMTEP